MEDHEPKEVRGGMGRSGRGIKKNKQAKQSIKSKGQLNKRTTTHWASIYEWDGKIPLHEIC